MAEEQHTPQNKDGASIIRRKIIRSDEDVLNETIANTVTTVKRAKKVHEHSFPPPHAMRAWRKFAHSRGLTVLAPVHLLAHDVTFFGDSDAMVEAEGVLTLNVVDSTVSVGKMSLTTKESEALADVAEELDDYAEWNIRDLRRGAPLPEQKDERKRWDLGKFGTVVRIGEGRTKRYPLFIYRAGWHLQSGEPPFDLPMFGVEDLADHPDRPVMVHEGPKAWEGAKVRLPGYVHVAWHAAEPGINWTDWSPLRGRDVLVWSDCDKAGVLTAKTLARRIARLGGVVGYLNWSEKDLEEHSRWDWANEGGLSLLNRHEILTRTSYVESPLMADGQLSPEWLSRSYLDLERREVYQASTGYRPMPLDALALGKPKGFRERLVESSINEFKGLDYRPGFPAGKLPDGKINLYRPPPPITAAPPTKRLLKLIDRWLKHMIPHRGERLRLLMRIALVVARPEVTPQHMILMQGDSGIGKSVLLDFIFQAVGYQNSKSLMPGDVFSRFNDKLLHTLLACIHEIHSEDVTVKQNTQRLKEMVANQYLSIEIKGRPRLQVSNVIHWFAASNEKRPILLQHGNDRFYFVTCVKVPGLNFATEIVTLLKDETFMDEVRSACAWFITQMKDKRIQDISGRARRQSVWEAIEEASRPGWAQEIDGLLERFEESGKAVFFADHFTNRLHKRYPRLPPADIRGYLSTRGYRALIKKSGRQVLVNMRVSDCGARATLWARKADYEGLIGQDPRMLARFLLNDALKE